MSLYTKQDFSPAVLSRRWLTMKFRPNILIYNHHHILCILESGLLFREDSVEVEQEAPSSEEVWKAAGGCGGGWLTGGERAASIVAMVVCVAAFPPKSFNRSTLLHLAAYLSLPLAVRGAHRSLARGCLAKLLSIMREYLALARRAAACLKEYAALHATIESISSVIESTHALLCRQQGALRVSMCRASSALLGNVPWLRGDVAWDAAHTPTHELTKIHHAFLVVQSTLLKHIAMAHFVPPPHARRVYKNHNERIHWIHHTLITNLIQEFRENYESLERMYRLLRNIGNSDVSVNKKLGSAIVDSWLYSDVHNGIARTCLELKLVANKCNSVDVFLDSCTLNKQEIDLNVLAKDVDELVDGITKCLSTVQSSQLRLRKIKNKMVGSVKVTAEENGDKREIVDVNYVQIENKDVEVNDQVFFFVKTEDDDLQEPAIDVTTGPGKKERDTTRHVLTELKRKLGKREDLMRERERQALVKTMPEYKDSMPEFPRQIKYEEFLIQKGYIRKLSLKQSKKRLFLTYKISKSKKTKRYQLKTVFYDHLNEIANPFYVTIENDKLKSCLITISIANKKYVLSNWLKRVSIPYKSKAYSSGMSEDLSEVEASTASKTINDSFDHNENFSRNYIVSKRDLELSDSTSESDFELYKEQQLALLKDIRRHRAARKKNHPDKKATIDKEDESLKPIEYSFGTGMAMASVLRINGSSRIPTLAQEEVFIGDGEVSNDSGNDEDA